MIRIGRKELDAIAAHAEAQYPHECCGALLGRSRNGARTVDGVVPVANRQPLDQSHNRFLIPAEDYRRLEKTAAARGLEVIGFYHSHPDHPATPSDFDREHALPWYAYVIVSVHEGRRRDVTCWTLVDDRSRFERETLSSDGWRPEGMR